MRGQMFPNRRAALLLIALLGLSIGASPPSGAFAEGIDPAHYRILSGRSLDPDRIAVLCDEGAIVIDADGRLRVTKDGFPVLDAVVADLAA